MSEVNPSVRPALRIAALVPATTAEGPGLRLAIWVQGCALRCPGCCNPEFFNAGRGEATEVSSVLARVDESMRAHGIEGLSILGGEPLEQIDGVTALAHGARRRGLGVLLFSGYRLDEAQRRPGFASLWSQVDTMLDGRFDAKQPEPPPHAGGRRFIGSRNQRLHHRTARYRDPSLWQGSPRIEVHLDDQGGFNAHGEPVAVRDLLRALDRR
ncbi:MAG: 4Fe-4S single cluster domain-containing protein [Myxococcota bacterium]